MQQIFQTFTIFISGIIFSPCLKPGCQYCAASSEPLPCFKSCCASWNEADQGTKEEKVFNDGNQLEKSVFILLKYVWGIFHV